MNTPKSAVFRRPSMVYVDVPPSPYSIVRDKSKAKGPPSVPHTNSVPSNAAPTLARSKTQVFVDIPPSPYHRNPAHRPMSSLVPVLAENRKRAIEEVDAEDIAPSKKSKLSTEGTVRCHQCKKPRNPPECLQCTFIVPVISKSNKSKDPIPTRCKEIYCQKCLQSRYSENLETIKASSMTGAERKGHVKKESYVFKCPTCKDICNCPRCRKAKGLEPIGRVPVEAIAKATAQDPLPVPKRGPMVKKTKPIPQVTWTPIPTTMSYDDLMARLHIHEFIIRFNPTFTSPVSKAHLHELERVNEENEESAEDLRPWVSEACVKSILLGLLDVIAADEGMEEDRPVIKETMKAMRAAGANLGKMYHSLSGLRTTLQKDLSDSDYDLRQLLASFPDPLPPPAHSSTRATRSAVNDSNGTTFAIVTSAQFVPLISALIEVAMRTDSVRGSLEEGAAEVKEMSRTYRDAVKKENELWDAQRENLKDKPEELKASRAQHKETLDALDSALKVITHAMCPRFAPLGVDDDGREYWAISPGIWERDLAYELLEAKAADAQKNIRSKRPKRLLLSEEDRETLNDWSWFVVAWGSMPPHGKLPESYGPEVDANKKQWWAFWQPEEIERLGKWLEAAQGSESESSLVKGLTDYAASLKWRIQVSTASSE